MKTISFDIDGCWSLHPSLFYAVACAFQAAQWRVVIITGSEQPHDKLERMFLLDFPIIVSGPLFKEQAARNAGYSVDVWVDDMPGMIQECRILAGETKDL